MFTSTRQLVLAYVLTTVVLSSAQAAEWQRAWTEGSSAGVAVRTVEFLRLRDLQLAPHPEVPAVPVRIQFGDGAGLPPLLVGESERIFTFVFVATTEHEGTTYAVTTRVMCIPRRGSQPFVWEPQGFTKKNSANPEEDPRVALRRIGLLPDGDIDFWYHKVQQPVAWLTLHEQLQAGYVFPFHLELVATRPAGYAVPSTIDAAGLRVRILGDGTAQVSFRDEAMTAAARERVMYQFVVEKRYGVDAAHLYRPIGESVVPAVPAVADQTFGIAQQAPYLNQALELNKFYRIQVTVARPSYGAVPVQAVEKSFAYIRLAEF